MSFDLYLYRSEGKNPLTEPEIDNVLSTIDGLEKAGSGWDYIDENDDLVFQLDFPDSGLIDHYNVASAGPAISFSCGWGSPDDLMKETIKTVAFVAERLDLEIYDSQISVSTHSETAIFDSWKAANLKVNDNFAVGKVIPQNQYRMPKSRMEYWKLYESSKPELQAQWETVDVFIPSPMLAVRKGETEAVSLAVWPNFIRTILPEVDYLIIDRKKRGLFGLAVGTEKVCISFSEVQRVMGTDFESIASPLNYYVYRKTSPRADAVKAIERLSGIPLSSFGKIPPQLIDIAVEVY